MQYPPLKYPKQLPPVLIYNPPGTPTYKMITTFMPRAVGDMAAFPVQQDKQKFLWIDYFIIIQRRFGFGEKFLKFAKNLSKELGCDGKIRLKAQTTIYDPINPPHKFYRKEGFGSDNTRMLRKIDRAIESNKQLDYRNTPAIEMYYPDDKKQGLLQKFLMKLHL